MICHKRGDEDSKNPQSSCWKLSAMRGRFFLSHKNEFISIAYFWGQSCYQRRRATHTVVRTVAAAQGKWAEDGRLKGVTPQCVQILSSTVAPPSGRRLCVAAAAINSEISIAIKMMMRLQSECHRPQAKLTAPTLLSAPLLLTPLQIPPTPVTGWAAAVKDTTKLTTMATGGGRNE